MMIENPVEKNVVCPDYEAKPETRAQQVILAIKATKDNLEKRETKATKARLVPLVIKATKVQLVRLETKETGELLAHREIKETKATKD
jgi:hypothetical protein